GAPPAPASARRPFRRPVGRGFRPAPSTARPKAPRFAGRCASASADAAGPWNRKRPAGSLAGRFRVSGSVPAGAALRGRFMMERSMRRPALVVLLAAGVALGGCAYNESLGRSQFLLVGDSALTQQADAAWAEALRTQRISSDAAANARIRRVAERVTQAAGMGGRSWDYAVFIDDSPNAFVLPSGKIGVTTGLL